MSGEALLWIIGAIVVGVVVFSIFAYRADVREREQWERFKVVHKCRIVARMEGSSETSLAPTINGNGAGFSLVTTQIPGKVAWLCDDGVTYWRNE